MFGWLVEKAAIEAPRAVEDKVQELLHERYPLLMDRLNGPSPASLVFPQRNGYEVGIPRGGSNERNNVGAQRNRRQELEELVDVYEQCIWTSVSANTIGRGCTGAGIRLVPDDIVASRLSAAPPTPAEQRFATLMKRCNDRENLIQILRSGFIDLVVTGDCYFEVGDILGEPRALWTLDACTMWVDADEHGQLKGYYQVLDTQRKRDFTPEQVIHVSLDAPRGGLYGTSPTKLNLLPIVTWLYTMACLKEQMKAGDMPRLWADFPRDVDVEEWYRKFMVRNRGARNISTPITTRGNAKLQPISQRQIADYVATLAVCRDQILSGYGVPPHKANVIEHGSLGSEGGAEAQDKTWRVDLVQPYQGLMAEPLQYRLIDQGYKIVGKHLEFGQVDMRDSKTIEEVRAIRAEHGVYTPSAWASDIGEPPVENGDQAWVKTRVGAIAVRDMPAYTLAQILGAAGQHAITVTQDADGTWVAVQPADDTVGEPAAGDEPPPDEPPNPPAPAPKGKPSRKSTDALGAQETMDRLQASANHAFQARRKQALKELQQ